MGYLTAVLQFSIDYWAWVIWPCKGHVLKGLSC